MRDSHQGMPEIINAFEQDAQYFGVVRIERDGVAKQFQFGVSISGYWALKRILQLRPFDLMPGIKQRYFFVQEYVRLSGSPDVNADIRVEQHRDGRQVEVRMPRDLHSNLLWFCEIKTFDEAAHLMEVE